MIVYLEYNSAEAIIIDYQLICNILQYSAEVFSI